jgi:hypothetical protein
MCIKNGPPANLTQALESWASIPVERFWHLVESMPLRIEAVLRTKGWNSILGRFLMFWTLCLTIAATRSGRNSPSCCYTHAITHSNDPIFCYLHTHTTSSNTHPLCQCKVYLFPRVKVCCHRIQTSGTKVFFSSVCVCGMYLFPSVWGGLFCVLCIAWRCCSDLHFTEYLLSNTIKLTYTLDHWLSCVFYWIARSQPAELVAKWTGLQLKVTSSNYFPLSLILNGKYTGNINQTSHTVWQASFSLCSAPLFTRALCG